MFRNFFLFITVCSFQCFNRLEAISQATPSIVTLRRIQDDSIPCGQIDPSETYSLSVFPRAFYVPDIYMNVQNTDCDIDCVLLCQARNDCLSGNYLHGAKECVLSKSSISVERYRTYQLFPTQILHIVYFDLSGSTGKPSTPATQLNPGAPPAGCGQPAFPDYYQRIPSPGPRGKRIVNGRVPSFYSRPWVALLHHIPSNDVACTVTLIQTKSADRNVKSDVVLTSAHCVTRPPFDFERRFGKFAYNDKNEYAVVFGKMDRRFKEAHEFSAGIRTVSVHPRYDAFDRNTPDIAAVKLDTEVVFNDYVRPVCLPTFAEEARHELTSCAVAGWGRTQIDMPAAIVLQEIDLQLTDDITAANLWRFLGGQGLDLMGTICANGLQFYSKAYKGDSGGPLTCWNAVRNAHVAYGLVHTGEIQCPLMPDRYIRLSNIMDWINENI